MMKKLCLIFIPLLIATAGFSQLPKNDKQNMQVLTNHEPFYPQGDQALYTYVLYNTKYSDEAKKSYLEGEVTLSFDVATDSSITNVIIISGVGSDVDNEVKKLVQTLKFVPALQNGVPVKMNAMYTFPVKAH